MLENLMNHDHTACLHMVAYHISTHHYKLKYAKTELTFFNLTFIIKVIPLIAFLPANDSNFLIPRHDAERF